MRMEPLEVVKARPTLEAFKGKWTTTCQIRFNLGLDFMALYTPSSYVFLCFSDSLVMLCKLSSFSISLSLYAMVFPVAESCLLSSG